MFSFDTEHDIPDHYFEKKKRISGRVISVHDGDGFRMLHIADKGLFSCLGEQKSNYLRKGTYFATIYSYYIM